MKKVIFIVFCSALIFSCAKESNKNLESNEVNIEVRSIPDPHCDGGQSIPPVAGLFSCDCTNTNSNNEVECCVVLAINDSSGLNPAPDGTLVQIITNNLNYYNNGNISAYPYDFVEGYVEDGLVTMCFVHPPGASGFLVHVEWIGCNVFNYSQCSF